MEDRVRHLEDEVIMWTTIRLINYLQKTLLGPSVVHMENGIIESYPGPSLLDTSGVEYKHGLPELEGQKSCTCDVQSELPTTDADQRAGKQKQTVLSFPGIVQCLKGKETDRSIEASRKEAETVIFDIVESALRKARLHPRDVDVLVINCSLFSPTPSLCAMVISNFGMRQDIQSFNLLGMGCGASLISVELAKDLLQRRRFRGGKALVVSTEIITPNLYQGNERGFLLQNTLFRCG
jgi:hypothetical protein